MKNVFLKLFLITIGCVTCGIGFNMFLIPNHIAAGGFSGIAILLNVLFNIKVGFATVILNVPLLIIAVKKLGKSFVAYTIFAIFAFSFSIDYILIPPITNDMVLCSIYGGVLVGAGLGLVLRCGYTSGGVDLLARLINLKYKEFPIGKLMFAIDFAVIIMSLVIVGYEEGLYALIAVFVSSKVIDIIVEGLKKSKAFFIITNNPTGISKKINTDIERGTTIWKAQGGYTGEDKYIVLCALNNINEISSMKHIIKQQDKDAFVLVSDMKEVLGEGFKED